MVSMPTVQQIYSLQKPVPEHIEPFYLGWAVGVIEGEGSFDRREIKVTQKDRALLDRLVDVLGGRVTTQGPKYFQWYITGSNMEKVVHLIYSHLTERRQAQVRKMRGILVSNEK